jgi:hypothetical protein
MNSKRKFFKGKLLTIALGSAVLSLGLANQANATLQVAINAWDATTPGPLTSVVVVDGGVGDTDGLVNNQIALGAGFSPVAGLVVQGSFYRSDLPGNLLTSGSATVINSSSQTIRSIVAVSDTGFHGPASSAFVTGSGTWTLATGSTIALRYYDDPNNAQGANQTFADLAALLAGVNLLTPGDLIAQFNNTSAGGPLDSFAHTNGPIAVADSGPFSMTLAFDLNLLPGGELISRGQSELKTVPEPASMALLGLGLLGLAATGRRKPRA